MNNSADFGTATVRYTVVVLVPPLDGGPNEVDSYHFVATTPVLPRTGESLEFDGPGAFSLSLIVTEVAHWFSPVGELSEPFKVTVEAKPASHGVADAQKLLDRVAFERWIEQFPTLELPSH